LFQEALHAGSSTESCSNRLRLFSEGRSFCIDLSTIAIYILQKLVNRLCQDFQSEAFEPQFRGGSGDNFNLL